jgi:hypothetical protein
MSQSNKMYLVPRTFCHLASCALRFVALMSCSGGGKGFMCSMRCELCGAAVAVRPLVQLQVVVREHQLLVLGRAVRADRRRPRPLVDEEDFGQHDDAEHGEEDDHDAERQVGSLAQPTRGARSPLLAAHPRQFCEKSIQKIRIIFQK